jgi:hypothetical protein
MCVVGRVRRERRLLRSCRRTEDLKDISDFPCWHLNILPPPLTCFSTSSACSLKSFESIKNEQASITFEDVIRAIGVHSTHVTRAESEEAMTATKEIREGSVRCEQGRDRQDMHKQKICSFPRPKHTSCMWLELLNAAFWSAIWCSIKMLLHHPAQEREHFIDWCSEGCLEKAFGLSWNENVGGKTNRGVQDNAVLTLSLVKLSQVFWDWVKDQASQFSLWAFKVEASLS